MHLYGRARLENDPLIEVSDQVAADLRSAAPEIGDRGIAWG